MGGTFHDLECHEPVRQQAQAPLRVAFRRRAASQGDEVRLLLAVELGTAAGTALPTAGERRLHPFLKAAPPGALDGGAGDLERCGDALVAAALVSQEQRARAPLAEGGGIAFGEHGPQLLTRSGRQLDRIELGHLAKYRWQTSLATQP